MNASFQKPIVIFYINRKSVYLKVRFQSDLRILKRAGLVGIVIITIENSLIHVPCCDHYYIDSIAKGMNSSVLSPITW